MQDVGSHDCFGFLLSVFYCAIVVLDLGLFRTSTELMRYGLDLEKSYPCSQKEKLHRRYQRDGRIGVLHCQPLRQGWFLTTTHGRDSLCEEPEVQRKSSRTSLAKFPRTDSAKRVRKFRFSWATSWTVRLSSASGETPSAAASPTAAPGAQRGRMGFFHDEGRRGEDTSSRPRERWGGLNGWGVTGAGTTATRAWSSATFWASFWPPCGLHQEARPCRGLGNTTPWSDLRLQPFIYQQSRRGSAVGWRRGGGEGG